MPVSTSPSGRSVVRESSLVWAAVVVGFPLVGAAAGWGLVALADWVVTLPWAPMQGVFELVERYSGTAMTITVTAIGAAAGLVLAGIGLTERLEVEVGTGDVELRRHQERSTIARSDVAAVFVDGKDLVLQRRDGAELARERCDLTAGELEAAFRAHGYPWREGDPYAAEFRPWVEDAAGLPPGANAVLRARAEAVQKDDKPHAGALRTELARLGVVVRDERKRQLWRPLEP